jgi:hypothetical protein
MPGRNNEKHEKSVQSMALPMTFVSSDLLPSVQSKGVGWGVGGTAGLQSPPKRNLKNTRFVGIMI